MSIQIEVDYNNKDKAKEKGAFWDTELKTWYIPDKKRIDDFLEFLPKDIDLIVKNPFFIAKSFRNCWKCGERTPLVTIGAQKFIALDYDEEKDSDIWKVHNELTYFHYIKYLPKHIITLITTQFPFYKQTFSKTIQDSYWANNCIHCGVLQGDYENFNEPSGTFLPIFPEDPKIELTSVDLKHDFPLIGDSSYGDVDFVIFK
jgi:hypothetical protein